MKRMITLLLALALTVSLAACGGQTGTDAPAAPEQTTQPPQPAGDAAGS